MFNFRYLLLFVIACILSLTTNAQPLTDISNCHADPACYAKAAEGIEHLLVVDQEAGMADEMFRYKELQEKSGPIYLAVLTGETAQACQLFSKLSLKDQFMILKSFPYSFRIFESLPATAYFAFASLVNDFPELSGDLSQSKLHSELEKDYKEGDYITPLKSITESSGSLEFLFEAMARDDYIIDTAPAAAMIYEKFVNSPAWIEPSGSQREARIRKSVKEAGKNPEVLKNTLTWKWLKAPRVLSESLCQTSSEYAMALVTLAPEGDNDTLDDAISRILTAEETASACFSNRANQRDIYPTLYKLLIRSGREDIALQHIQNRIAVLKPFLKAERFSAERTAPFTDLLNADLTFSKKVKKLIDKELQRVVKILKAAPALDPYEGRRHSRDDKDILRAFLLAYADYYQLEQNHSYRKLINPSNFEDKLRRNPDESWSDYLTRLDKHPDRKHKHWAFNKIVADNQLQRAHLAFKPYDWYTGDFQNQHLIDDPALVDKLLQYIADERDPTKLKSKLIQALAFAGDPETAARLYKETGNFKDRNMERFLTIRIAAAFFKQKRLEERDYWIGKALSVSYESYQYDILFEMISDIDGLDFLASRSNLVIWTQDASGEYKPPKAKFHGDHSDLYENMLKSSNPDASDLALNDFLQRLKLKHHLRDDKTALDTDSMQRLAKACHHPDFGPNVKKMLSETQSPDYIIKALVSNILKYGCVDLSIDLLSNVEDIDSTLVDGAGAIVQSGDLELLPEWLAQTKLPNTLYMALQMVEQNLLIKQAYEEWKKQ